MLSLTPFFTNAFVPALSTYNLNDSQLDRDLARLYAVTSEQPTVYHRQPNYSVIENDEQAYVEVELPGVAKENINLDIADKKLVLSAKRFRGSQTVNNTSDERKEDGKKDASGEEEPKLSVIYELKIRIRNKYNTENIQASMDGNGILKMVIPIKNKESSRKIVIE